MCSSLNENMPYLEMIRKRVRRIETQKRARGQALERDELKSLRKRARSDRRRQTKVMIQVMLNILSYVQVSMLSRNIRADCIHSMNLCNGPDRASRTPCSNC